MLCAPTDRRLAAIVSYENGGLQVISRFVRILVRKKIGLNSEKCIGYGKWRQSVQ